MTARLIVSASVSVFGPTLVLGTLLLYGLDVVHHRLHQAGRGPWRRARPWPRE